MAWVAHSCTLMTFYQLVVLTMLAHKCLAGNVDVGKDVLTGSSSSGTRCSGIVHLIRYHLTYMLEQARHCHWRRYGQNQDCSAK